MGTTGLEGDKNYKAIDLEELITKGARGSEEGHNKVNL
jgi:hypothetical protein